MTQYQDKLGNEARIGYAATTAGALAQVGIDPENAVSVPGETTTPTQPTQPTQGGTTPPATSGGQSGSQRDNAVKAMGAALDDLKSAQQNGDFKAYGEALEKLKKAVDTRTRAADRRGHRHAGVPWSLWPGDSVFWTYLSGPIFSGRGAGLIVRSVPVLVQVTVRLGVGVVGKKWTGGGSVGST